MKITTAAEMRDIDRVTSERFGVHSLGLMENAGTAVATFVRDYYPKANRITVICGKGNNGGDGFVAARKLHQAGKVVEVLLLADSGELKGDAANMFGRLPLKPVFIRSEQELRAEMSRGLGNADVVIDAILGTGFKPPAQGLYGAAINAINQLKAPVVAIDIPSGADADAFALLPQGSFSRADAVVTFTAPRPSHVFGGLTRGPIIVAPIGSPDEAISSKLDLEVITARDVAPLISPRALDANKGRFGHALVIGGSLGKAGAAALAGGHAGIASGVDPNGSCRRCENGAMTFQNQQGSVFASKLSRDSDALFLNICDLEASEPRHLAGMWREDERTRAPIEFLHRILESIETVGIKYDSQPAARDSATYELNGVRVPC